MLRRQRQIRTQFYRLLDATLFVLSLWLAHTLRDGNVALARLGGPVDIQPFKDFAWLLLIIIPAGPFFLEMHGYYTRPLIASRRRTAWQLFQSCVLSVLLMIVLIFFINPRLSRA